MSWLYYVSFGWWGVPPGTIAYKEAKKTAFQGRIPNLSNLSTKQILNILCILVEALPVSTLNHEELLPLVKEYVTLEALQETYYELLVKILQNGAVSLFEVLVPILPKSYLIKHRTRLLYHAVTSDNERMLLFLLTYLQENIDVFRFNSQRSFLRCALLRGKFSLVKEILGWDTILEILRGGMMSEIIQKQESRLLEILWDLGLGKWLLQSPEEHYETLCLAARRGSFPIFEVLVQKGLPYEFETWDEARLVKLALQGGSLGIYTKLSLKSLSFCPTVIALNSGNLEIANRTYVPGELEAHYLDLLYSRDVRVYEFLLQRGMPSSLLFTESHLENVFEKCDYKVLKFLQRYGLSGIMIQPFLGKVLKEKEWPQIRFLLRMGVPVEWFTKERLRSLGKRFDIFRKVVEFYSLDVTPILEDLAISASLDSNQEGLDYLTQLGLNWNDYSETHSKIVDYLERGSFIGIC